MMQRDTLLSRAGLEGSDAATPPREQLIRGDDTGSSETLIYLDADRVGRFTSWSELESRLGAERLLRVDPGGCQFMLAYGLVPPPYTLYSNVYCLGAGDRLRFDLDGDRAAFEVDFPYFENRSRCDERFEPDRLKRLLAGAVSRAVPPGEPALLLQSSGKDSSGIVLGIAESGRTDIRCATYDPGYRERESEAARSLARRFGLGHRAVEADPREECAALLRFAERSPSICADMALLAYLRILDCCGVDGGAVIDGLGNDAYMGYVLPRADRWLAGVALARRLPALWGRFEPPDLGARAAYLVKSALMYPAERSLAGSRLSPRAVCDLVPHETPFRRFFGDLDRKYRHLSPADFRAYVRGRIFDGCGTLVKGRLAAAHHRARIVYPYCDPELIDYCFNLPLEDRYDPRRRTNKIALRRLLERDVGDAYYLRHKGSFRYDVLGFVAANEQAIRSELDRASRLFHALDRWAEYYWRRRSNYVHAYALMTLFILAAWLVRRPAEVTEPLSAPGAAPPAANVEVAL